MILCVSIGNTNIRCAFGTKECRLLSDIPTKAVCRSEDFAGYLEEQFGSNLWERAQGSIVTSVVTDKTPAVMDAIQVKTNKSPQQIDISKLNIDISGYRGNLGEDRALCCAAALTAYTPPIIVVDLGTATTINFINAKGAFIGGAILAGLHMGLDALYEHTSLLPRVNDFSNVREIGNDTNGCLISGAVIGTASMLEGYIDRLRADLGGKPSVIITGGSAPPILPHCRFDFIHRPTLLLDELFTQYKP